MILFCLLCMAGASLARPQVESVTDLESLQEDFTTDSPILETADTKGNITTEHAALSLQLC